MPTITREYSGSFSGCEGEVEYEIEFEITSKGLPARGPSLSSPGEPAEAPEFQITTVSVETTDEDGKLCWMDIRKVPHYSPEAIAHIESWAEDQVDGDVIISALQDEADAAADYAYEACRDRMTGYDD